MHHFLLGLVFISMSCFYPTQHTCLDFFRRYFTHTYIIMLGYEDEVLSPLYQFFQPACARRVPTLHLQLPPQQPQQPFHATSFFP
jgi:hypothetical protein